MVKDKVMFYLKKLTPRPYHGKIQGRNSPGSPSVNSVISRRTIFGYTSL